MHACRSRAKRHRHRGRSARGQLSRPMTARCASRRGADGPVSHAATPHRATFRVPSIHPVHPDVVQSCRPICVPDAMYAYALEACSSRSARVYVLGNEQRCRHASSSHVYCGARVVSMAQLAAVLDFSQIEEQSIHQHKAFVQRAAVRCALEPKGLALALHGCSANETSQARWAAA
jgi:hypothetical protein